MTEAEWLAADRPFDMLEHVRRRKATARVRRLLAHYDDLGTVNGVLREVLQAAADAADGVPPKGDLARVAARRAWDAVWATARYGDGWANSWNAVRNEAHTAAHSAALTVVHGVLARELLCVFGNPFQSTLFLQTWRTATATALAEAAYADRAFDRLPVLADALEDAGCDAAELLAHLHGPGPHARGCWALDLVLGKS